MDTKALVEGLRSGVVSMAGLDVYEKESSYFFRDCSDTPVQVCDGGTARCPRQKDTPSTTGRSLCVVLFGISRLSFFSCHFSIFSFFHFLSFSFGPVPPSIDANINRP